MKIAHYLASAGLCSRRQGEKLVQQGLVSVNSQIVINPAERIKETDTVHLEGKKVELITEPKLFGYYKPVRVLVTHAQEQGRDNVFDLVQSRLGNVISVGRLDFMSEGLLLLTDSNKLCSELMHGDLKRKYKVLVSDIPSNFDVVTKHFVIDGIRYLPWKIENIHDNWITVGLTEGKNREIRKVFEFFGVQVKRLIRIQYGQYRIQGSPDDLWQLK